MKTKSISLPLVPVFLAAVLALATPAAVQAQLVGYTDRSQVNLMNARDATLTFSGTNASGNTLTDNQTRFAIENAASMLGRAVASTDSPSFTMDFGTTRNIKTVSTHAHNANYGISAATVETSNDGVNWTVRNSTFSNQTTASFRATLDTAVDARYVRVTPTTFQNGPNGTDERWFVSTVRAFGDTGAMAGDSNLTILANGGFSAAQSLTAVGTITQIAPAQIIKPNVDPVGRQLLYSIENGEGFKLDLGQNFTVDRGVINVTNIAATSDDPVTMTIAGSTDDSNYTNLYSQIWTSNVMGANLISFDMDVLQGSRYLTYTFSDPAGLNLGGTNGIRVSDLALYQIPEPSAFGFLAGVMALFMVGRRRPRATQS